MSDTTEALVFFIINPPNQFNNFIGVFFLCILCRPDEIDTCMRQRTSENNGSKSIIINCVIKGNNSDTTMK